MIEFTQSIVVTPSLDHILCQGHLELCKTYTFIVTYTWLAALMKCSHAVDSGH